MESYRNKRNEPLDLRNYAYAALKIANPNLNKKYTVEATKKNVKVQKEEFYQKE